MTAEPTHRTIISEIATLKEMSAERDRRVQDVQASVGEIHRDLSAGQVRFARIEANQDHHAGMLVEIRDALRGGIARNDEERKADRGRLTALENSNIASDAQIGVWKAIVNSKPVLAFLSALAAAAAWLIGKGQ